MATSTETTQDRKPNLTEKTGVVIVTYNHDEYIEDCLKTVFDNEPGEVLVVDNGSTDGTVDTVKTEFSEAEVIQPEGNLGYGRASNHGVAELESEYVVVLNPDTRIDSDLIEELVSPVAENGKVITTPKILTYDKSEINTIGNVVHFTGLAFTRGYRYPPESYARSERLAGISGACFATSRDTYQEMGGFEESIFIYMDDVELSWKANAMDIDILYVPSATISHDYPGVDVDDEKLYHLEYGRYIILQKYLSAETAALLLPSLLLSELLTFGYAVRFGWSGVTSKLRAIFDGFSTDVETINTDNRALLHKMDTRIPPDQIQSSQVVQTAIRITNKIYEKNISVIDP